MSKGKKQVPKEEPLKLDMSFEDAIRLAMKTAPANQIKLVVNEKKLLPNASGRTIEFLSIAFYNLPEDADNFAMGFQLEVHIKNNKDEWIKSFTYISMVDPTKNKAIGFFNLYGTDSRVVVQQDETLYLRLLPPNNRETQMEFAVVDYVTHLSKV